MYYENAASSFLLGAHTMYDALRELLGKSVSGEASGIVNQFGEPWHDGGEETYMLTFPQSSLSMIVHQERYQGFLLHVWTASVQCGEMKPYSGILPGGIGVSARPEDIQKALGIEPFQTQRIGSDLSIYYKLGGYIVGYDFDMMDKKLSGVSCFLSPEAKLR